MSEAIDNKEKLRRVLCLIDGTGELTESGVAEYKTTISELRADIISMDASLEECKLLPMIRHRLAYCDLSLNKLNKMLDYLSMLEAILQHLQNK